jgi:hypothetical protein
MRKQRNRRRGWLASMVVVLGGVGGISGLVFTPEANAQVVAQSFNFDFGNMSDFATPVTGASLKSYGKMLGLDASQKEAIEALHQGYLSQHQALMKEMQDKMKEVQEKFNETKDFTVWQKDLPTAMKTLTEKMEGQEKEFFDDFKAMLSDEQAGGWSGIERHRRREKNLKFGLMAGESVDLVRVAERSGLNVDTPGEVREAIQSYEAEMDKVLVAKEKFAKEVQAEMGDGSDMNKAMENAQKMMKAVREIGRQQRSINKDYSGRVHRALPEGEAAKFLAEYRKAAFPRVYRQPATLEAIQAAEGMDDLDTAQKQTVSAIREQYERELAAANEKWASAVEANDDAIGDDPMAMARLFMPGQNDQGPLGDAKKARRELDERTRERLSAALNPKQREKLPKTPSKHETDGSDGQFEVSVEASDDGGEHQVKVITVPGGG